MIQTNSLCKAGKIFIGGLGTETQIETLKKYFEKYGEIIDSVIMIDKITNRSRGFGFITFKDSSNIDNLLKDQPHFIDGKQVECKIAIPKEQINTISEANFDESAMSYKAHKIFVGGLPPNLKESEMHNYFAKFGEIEQCVIMHDKPSGKSRGFGFVIFRDEKSIDMVMDMKNNHNIMGKWVDCKRAMPKEVIKEASFKNLKQLEQKSQREISSKFNTTSSYQETIDKSAFMGNQVLNVHKKENFEDSANKKKKMSSLISEDLSQNNQNLKNSSTIKSPNSVNPSNINEKNYNTNIKPKDSNPNGNTKSSASNHLSPLNKGNSGLEASNHSNNNNNINNFAGNNQNQSNSFYGINYNNFYANSNIININNFNYPQNFMYQQNMANPMFAPGYPLSGNSNGSNQINFPGVPNNLNSLSDFNKLNKNKKIDERDNLEADQNTNLSSKLSTKKAKNFKFFEAKEETLNQSLTDYSEENRHLRDKAPLENSDAEVELPEENEESEYEDELVTNDPTLNEVSAQQQDANKFNFNFSYNYNNINNPFMPGMPGFPEATSKIAENVNPNLYLSSCNNINNNPNNTKFSYANNNTNNPNNANNFFGFSNPNQQQPFGTFNNNYNSPINNNINNNSSSSFPFNDFAGKGHSNSSIYPFAGFNDGFNFSLFSGHNTNKNNFNNNNNNFSNSTSNNFNSINPNIFPNGSANKNVYNFFNTNYNNNNNSLMNYNIFDMINADSALIFSYFNKLNLDEDSGNYGYKNGNKLSSYYQYKLFDFNGENINFECLNYDQNKEKVQLFKEDELEKEKYNIAKTIDEESIEEKLENENFFGPHKENTKKDRVFKPY